MLFQALLIASRLTPNLLEVWKCFWGEGRRSQQSGTCGHFILYYIDLNVEDFREGGQRGLPWVSQSLSSYVCFKIWCTLRSTLQQCATHGLHRSSTVTKQHFCCGSFGRQGSGSLSCSDVFSGNVLRVLNVAAKPLKEGTGEGCFQKLVIFSFPFLLSFSLLLFFSYRKNHFLVLGVKEAQNENLQR